MINEQQFEDQQKAKQMNMWFQFKRLMRHGST